MPRYLDTRGHSKLAIAICGRCSVKYAWDELVPDPNTPGLLVCRDGCLDQFDPWRLAPRETENITLQWARPDDPLWPEAPANVPVKPLQAILSTDGITGIAGAGQAAIAIAPPATPISIAQPWAANSAYPIGYQVTAGLEYGSTTAAGIQKVFLCLVPGQSGPTPPAWNTANGTITQDNQVSWLCNGFFLP